MSLENSEWNQKYLALVAKLCEPAPGALKWFLDLLDIGLVWDHLVDDEIEADDVTRANRMFEAILTRWPLNPFYSKNATLLIPPLAAAISAWRFSNQPGAPKLKAYDVYTEIPMVMALIIGGMPRVNEFSIAIRECSLHRMVEDDEEDGGKK